MRALDPRARWLWLAAMVLLVANGLAFLFLVLPARDQRLGQEQQLLDLQRRIRGLQREGESGEVVLAAFREVEEFAQGFPPRADLVGLIGRLTRLGRSVAVNIPTVDYKPSEIKDAGLTKVTLTMAVEGTYNKIRRYLYELEAMRRHLVIERVTLTDPKGNSELQVQLQLSVYVR
jgi:Tfp pilus assembly protein PilO